MTNEEKYKTIEERKDAFNAFCDQYCTCKDCPISDYRKIIACRYGCVLYWLALEAEEEKPLDCPFCGGECVAHHDDERVGYAVFCLECKANSRVYTNKADAIAAWNRRAK